MKLKRSLAMNAVVKFQQVEYGLEDEDLIPVEDIFLVTFNNKWLY